MNLNKVLLIAVAVLAPLQALATVDAPWIEGKLSLRHIRNVS